MSIEFSPATEAQEIGQALIPKHHSHLIGARIEYVFRSKASKSKGQELWGKARKVTGLNAYLAGGDAVEGTEEFFVVEVAADIWKELGDKQKRALIDHELYHCVTTIDEQTGETHLAVAPHDVEEFAEVIKRHGLWRGDVKAFVQAAQGELDIN